MVEEAAKKIKELLKEEEFFAAVVGGSGIELPGVEREIPYSEIPNMPLPAVPGHKGVVKLLSLNGKKILFFEGRFHYYEGREDWEIRFIPELCSFLGVRVFIPTCASGAVSRKAAESEIGVIYDHINLLGRNPLVGLIKSYGARVFVNGKKFYSKRLVNAFLKKALELGIDAVPAVLAANLGPNYETYTEIRLLEVLGVDCVSMSTVPEVIAANFYGMECVALTVFTNDTLNPEASHEEVLEKAAERSAKLGKLIGEALIHL
ncbi:purine-nucleoside phosphorylase [Thermovibrio ammonificans]